jgi:hypothetical protein
MCSWNIKQVRGVDLGLAATQFSHLEGSQVSSQFDQWTEQWHHVIEKDFSELKTIQDFLQRLHFCNFMLWHFEDEARRIDVEDSAIVHCKREIDKFNQRRNDGIEAIDQWIADQLKNIHSSETAAVNSETPGSIIDRLSILSLKIYHMFEQTGRRDVNDMHIKKAQQRLSVFKEQRHDLSESLDCLWQDLVRGNKRHKIYRQYKMYNDPETNPALYSQGKS